MKRTTLLGSLVLTAALTLIPAGAVFAQTGPEVTVASIGTFDAQTGVATLTGTFACGDSSGFATIELVLSQQVGRVSTVSGSSFADIPECTPGATGTWTALVPSSNGEFRGGQAQASARILVDGSTAETGAAIRLRG
ncbi:hypothetical protein [Kitasatospora sp. NPDC051914]|uniref:hypothetical protein n=1 Tax=Kitasatospora sp. NPDC051914 TaxID=3154945 RepID=UPI00342C1BD7